MTGKRYRSADEIIEVYGGLLLTEQKIPRNQVYTGPSGAAGILISKLGQVTRRRNVPHGEALGRALGLLCTQYTNVFPVPTYSSPPKH